MANLTFKKNGKAVVRAYGGMNPSTGRPRVVSETLPADATEQDLRDAFARVEARAAVTKGNTAVMTIETATGYDLECCEADGMAATTLASYRSYRTKHIIPRIGRISLDAAEPLTFTRFFRDLTRPAADGGHQKPCHS